VSDVFLDAVGAVALINVSDQWHPPAKAAYDQIKRTSREFITTSLVLFEAGNALARTRYREDAADLWQVLSDRGKLVTSTLEDCEAGWQLYRRGEAGSAGIVDCVSFAIMRRLGLAEAFTNDQHFAAAGFTPLF
jgi:predicted nucleic acid-binding protein